MQRSLLRECFASLAELEQFVCMRGNEIQLTMPRPMRVSDIASVAAQLFAEVVLPRRSRSRVLASPRSDR
jgi:hypothetical protein